MSESDWDLAIVGGGMAGVSVAGVCSDQARVIVLEAEEHPAYHATGRSAAAFVPTLSAEISPLRLLTKLSKNRLLNPPAIFGDASLLHKRGLLTLFRDGSGSALDEYFEYLQRFGGDPQRVDQNFSRGRVPCIKANYCGPALYEPEAYDIDVHGLHQGYLRLLKANGGELRTGTKIAGLRRVGGRWEIATSQGPVNAKIVVNAAGAWADAVGALAGCAEIGLSPLRRTAVLVAPPEGVDVSDWPLVLAKTEGFYFKPEAGNIMVSPADEIPGPPCDADGFVADRVPVVGFDPQVDDFFWMAGQGGHGIQIAPALADVAASLLLKQPLPGAFDAEDFDLDALAPDRLRI